MNATSVGALARDYAPLLQFQAANALVFPTEQSLRWFLRVHRRELVESGALVEIAGRLLIHPQRFATAAAEIGRRNLVRAL